MSVYNSSVHRDTVDTKPKLPSDNRLLQRKLNAAEVDFTLIGSGLSSTFALLNLIKRVKANRPRRPIKIVNIERSGEYFAGNGYGKSTGEHTLLISPFVDFLPDAERAEFKVWLRDNAHALLRSAMETATGDAMSWLQSNYQTIISGDIDDISLPRRWVARYFSSVLSSAIVNATDEGLIDFTTLHGEATSIEKVASASDQHRSRIDVSLASGEQLQLSSKRVLLGLGLPQAERRLIAAADSAISNDSPSLVDNPYEPGFDETMRDLETSIDGYAPKEGTEKLNVLLVGTNASALEMLYRLNGTRASKIGKFVLLSPSGGLPWRYGGRGNNDIDPSTESLDRLASKSNLDADDVLEAAVNDNEINRSRGISFPRTYQAIWSAIWTPMSRLSNEEKKRFACHQGAVLGRCQRRMIDEYADLVDELKANGRITIVAGALKSIAPNGNAQQAPFLNLKVGYTDSSGDEATIPETIQIAINCSSPEKVDGHISSTLLRNLLQSGLVTANPSLRGLEVDDSFQANRGLYVLGPLLAGNIVANNMIWHLESCPRILGLSTKLVDVWIRELSAERFFDNDSLIAET